MILIEPVCSENNHQNANAEGKIMAKKKQREDVINYTEADRYV